jgi:hypothetical protein
MAALEAKRRRTLCPHAQSSISATTISISSERGRGSNARRPADRLFVFHSPDVWQLKGNCEHAIANFGEAICLAPQGPDYYIGRAKAQISTMPSVSILVTPKHRRGAAWGDKADLTVPGELR